MAITKVTSGGIKDNAITSDKISDGSISNNDLGATLDLSSKTVTLPSASVTAHATNPTKSSIEALGIDVPATDLTGTIPDARFPATLPAIDGSSLTNLPAGGGITEADTWRLTSLFTGNAAPISSNWQRDSAYGGGTMGTGMSQSSGIFTFPSTGFWSVHFFSYHYDGADCRSIATEIEVTTNNSTYNTACYATSFVQQTSSDSAHTTISNRKIVDVTDTTNVKVRFKVGACSGVTTRGETAGTNYTGVIFIRLGDT